MAEKKDDDATEKARLDKYRYIDVGALNDAQIKELVDCPDPKSTMKKIEKYEVKRSEWKKEDWLKPAPLSFVEELTCIAIFLFVIPCAALFLPIVVGLIFHYYGWKVGTAITVILAASTMKLPKFSMNALQSWQSVSFLRYFSFKGSFAQKLDLSKPYILVAPPHGVIFRFLLHIVPNISLSTFRLCGFVGFSIWQFANYDCIPIHMWVPV